MSDGTPAAALGSVVSPAGVPDSAARARRVPRFRLWLLRLLWPESINLVLEALQARAARRERVVREVGELETEIRKAHAAVFGDSVPSRASIDVVLSDLAYARTVEELLHGDA